MAEAKASAATAVARAKAGAAAAVEKAKAGAAAAVAKAEAGAAAAVAEARAAALTAVSAARGSFDAALREAQGELDSSLELLRAFQAERAAREAELEAELEAARAVAASLKAPAAAWLEHLQQVYDDAAAAQLAADQAAKGPAAKLKQLGQSVREAKGKEEDMRKSLNAMGGSSAAAVFAVDLLAARAKLKAHQSRLESSGASGPTDDEQLEQAALEADAFRLESELAALDEQASAAAMNVLQVRALAPCFLTVE